MEKILFVSLLNLFTLSRADEVMRLSNNFVYLPLVAGVLDNVPKKGYNLPEHVHSL